MLEHQDQQRREDLERQRQDLERQRQDSERQRQEFQALIKTLVDKQQTTSSEENQTQAVNNGASSQSTKVHHVNRPSMLDVDVTYSRFRSWRMAWNDYYMLQKLENQPLEVQKADFRCSLTNEMRTHLKCAIDIADQNDFTVSEILDKIQEYLRQKRSIALDRVAFEERRQEHDESFDEFYVSLRNLAEESDICEKCYEQRITTRIMSGIKDKNVRQKLLAINPFPDLKTVVNLCRSEESATKDSSALDSKISIEKIKKTSYRREKNDQQKKADTCKKCGYDYHEKSKCPANKSECKKCHSIGHWAKMCLTKDPSRKQQEQKNSNKKFFVQNIKCCKISNPTPKIKIKCSTNRNNQVKIIATPDTGAEVSICGPDVISKMNINKTKLQHCKENLQAANGSEIKTIGSIKMKLEVGGIAVQEDVIICKNQKEFLLSWIACRKLRLIPDDFPKPIKAVQRKPTKKEETIEERREKIFNEFSDVFSEENTLKPMSGEPMKIYLKDNVQPTAVRTARNIAFAYREKVKEELDKMEQKQIIVPLKEEPTDWCHPMVVVEKPSGGIRICVDYSKLNEHVKRPSHPLKTPKDAVNNISPGSKYFSTFDATQGYWQIPLHEESQHLTTFITPWGRYMFRRAPMGLCSTGDEYCRRGDQALQGLKNVQKVVDDSILFDEDLDEHLKNVRKYLEMCRESGITLNKKKAHIAEEKVTFAGYEVDGEGVKADPKKIKAIQQFPQPKNLTDLRSFLGLANQLGCFCKDLSLHTNQLRGLLSSKNHFNWTPDHTSAFEKIKDVLCKPPTLSHFDPKLPTYLQSDAARNAGLGYALLQKNGEKMNLIQCGSRFLSETEARYATIEMELLGIVWATKKCEMYLKGMSHFTIITDHNPLVGILDKKTLDEVENPRLQRLKEKMLSYNFETKWISGKQHAIPDALSRAPVDYPEESDQLLKEENLIIKAVRCQERSYLEDGILEDLKEKAAADPKYQDLIKMLEEGFPKSTRSLPPHLRIFGTFEMIYQWKTDWYISG